MPQRRHHQSPIQIPVEPLAGGLGNKQAAMASCAFKVSLGIVPLGRVPRANRVVGTEPAQFKRPPQVAAQVSPLLYQSPQSSFRARAAGGEKDGSHGSLALN